MGKRHQRKRAKVAREAGDQWADQREAELQAGLKARTIIPVDRSKVVSRSVLPVVPDYYRDTWITCRDCGQRELWTAKKQQRWYEEKGGEIETVAIRCRLCRKQEQARRETVRQLHFDGLRKKAELRARTSKNRSPDQTGS
jgi:hypothetical protein